MKMNKVKLGDRLEFLYGFSVRVNNENEGKYPVYGSNGITGFIDNYKINGPGIIIGRKGSVGKVSFSKDNFTPTDTAYYVQIINETKDDLKFWFYYLPLLGLEKLNTHSSVPGLSREIAYLLDVNPPNLPTQTAIARVLSSLDDKIELNNRINKELESMAKMIYEYWFVQNADRKWKKEKLVNISELVQAGGTPSRKEKSYFQGDINWFTTGELNDTFTLSSIEKISKEAIEQSSAKLFPKGSVLIAIYASPTAGKLGILSEVGTFNQAIAGIVPKGEFSTEYIYMTLLIERYKLLSLASGTAQKNLSTQIVKDFEITIPPTPILQKFNKTVSPIFSAILKNLQESANLAQLRDFLLPLLMNGQVGINKC